MLSDEESNGESCDAVPDKDERRSHPPLPDRLIQGGGGDPGRHRRGTRGLTDAGIIPGAGPDVRAECGAELVPGAGPITGSGKEDDRQSPRMTGQRLRFGGPTRSSITVPAEPS